MKYLRIPEEHMTRRALEVLLPHLERAADCPFEEQETHILLANHANLIRNVLGEPV